MNRFFAPRYLSLGNRETGSQVRILKNETVLGLPNWSPDQKQIVVTIQDGDERVLSIFSPEVTTTQSLELWRQAWDDEYEETCPSWSPDGKSILFTNWNTEDAQTQILIVDVREGAVPIEVELPDPNWNLRDCAWSADGTRILFAAFGDDGKMDVPSYFDESHP